MVTDVTDQDFEKEVIKSTLPVLVDLWAPWCGPCRMVAPVVDKLAERYNGKFKFCRLNVDENPQMVSQYAIPLVPYLLILKAAQPFGAFAEGWSLDQVKSLVSREIKLDVTD